MNNIELIEDLRENLPESVAGIGYGSGMFYQKGYSANEKPDKDVILVVNNLHRFLTEDYQMHPEHFPKNASKKYGKIENKNVKWFNNKIGCLKFSHNAVNFKLLITEKDALLYDLLSWNHFSLAGRLSKPITYGNIPEEIEDALRINCDNILKAALLATPEAKIVPEELYKTIAKLSYNGDIRMVLNFEKQSKATDIVDGSFNYFEQIYGRNPILTYDGDKIVNPYSVDFFDDLPASFVNDVISKLNNEDLDKLADDDNLKETLQMAINDTFYKKNLINSLFLLYSCERTLGPKQAISHAITKKLKSFRR